MTNSLFIVSILLIYLSYMLNNQFHTAACRRLHHRGLPAPCNVRSPVSSLHVNDVDAVQLQCSYTQQ